MIHCGLAGDGTLLELQKRLREHFKESIEAYEKALDYGKKSGNIYLISTIVYKLASLEVANGALYFCLQEMF